MCHVKGINILYVDTKRVGLGIEANEVMGIGLKHDNWFLQQILNARDAVKDPPLPLPLPPQLQQCNIPYDDTLQPMTMTMNRGDDNSDHVNELQYK
jgi:hypothetical protein